MNRTHIAAMATALAMTACGGAQTQTSSTTIKADKADNLPESAVCPVMKSKFKPTAKTVTATHKGKTYYFCCPGCDKKFAADPEKYLAAGPATAKAPEAAKSPCGSDCVDGCTDCKNPTAANGAAAAPNGVKMMVGADLGDALPATAKCTISGKEFKPSATTQVAEYNGKKHFFCCGGCASKFSASPEKFAAK